MQQIPLYLERKLHFVRKGHHSDGWLKIGPINETENGIWACKYSISIIDENGGVSRGIDPLDAFNRCLRSIKNLIEGSEKDGFCTVWWLKEGDQGALNT